MQASASPTPSFQASTVLTPWQAASLALGSQGIAITAESLAAGMPAVSPVPPEVMLNGLRKNDCWAELRMYSLSQIPTLLCPALIWTKTGEMQVLYGVKSVGDRQRAQVMLPALGDSIVEMDLAELQDAYMGLCILFKGKSQVQSREPAWLALPKKHWLWQALVKHKRMFLEAALATVIINLLALAGTFFTMTVYDRVIPNNAFATLWVMVIGVVLAQVFEFLARQLRSHLIDEAGKKTDLLLGMNIFSHAIATRLENAPNSSGTYANLLREYETVREFFTSLTLTLIADLPFVILFVGVMAFISPSLAVVPLVAAPLLILVALLVQWPMARLMRQRFGDSSQRQGMLVEALENLETLKANRAEGYMQALWESMSASLAQLSKQTTSLSNWVNNWANFIQQTAAVALLIVGTYLIAEGKITQGALVGCMILIGRTLSPLTQLVSLGLRLQQTKVAMRTLDNIFASPTDRPERAVAIQAPKGFVEARGLGYQYADGLPFAVKNIQLAVQPGERVLLLGRVGSGKSTLLRNMAGLYRPTEGMALLDNINLNQIDPANARRTMGFSGQDARLFYGTLADNIRLNRPDVSEADMIWALQVLQLHHMVNQHPLGLGMPVGEHGRNLSGGQRQLVALARTLVSRPKVLLLDEPTSAMDDGTEQMVLKSLSQALPNVTMVVSTHRQSLLSIATRVVVLEQGQVILDAPKEEALDKLRKGLTVNQAAPVSGSIPKPQTL